MASRSAFPFFLSFFFSLSEWYESSLSLFPRSWAVDTEALSSGKHPRTFLLKGCSGSAVESDLGLLLANFHLRSFHTALFCWHPPLCLASRFRSVILVMHNLFPKRRNKDWPSTETATVIFCYPLLEIHPDCSNHQLIICHFKVGQPTVLPLSPIRSSAKTGHFVSIKYTEWQRR